MQWSSWRDVILQIRILSEKTEDVKKMISFKEEANKVIRENAIDIQLGQEGGKGLEIFNRNLKKYEVIKENK